MTEQSNLGARIVRSVALALVIVLLFGLIVYNSVDNTPMTEKVWDEQMTVGNLETATRHYVMYTDILCPYCDVFSRLTIENWDEFLAYLDEHKIAFEVRVTDMLYYNGHNLSLNAAVGAYCAAEENKFWDYYHNAVMSLWEDYHSRGIGSSKMATPITDMTANYWFEVGHEVGLGEQFDNCMSELKTLSLVEENTEKSSGALSGYGLPYFQFEKFATGGFDPSWDFSYVLKLLDAGL